MTMARGLATVVGSVLISTGVFCLLLITVEGGSEPLTVIKRRFISMFSPPSSGIFFPKRFSLAMDLGSITLNGNYRDYPDVKKRFPYGRLSVGYKWGGD